MPWVFLGSFVMMIASQFTVAGASALRQALRPLSPRCSCFACGGAVERST